MTRALFCVGPGDCVAAGGDWLAARATPEVTFKSYTAETLDACRELGWEAWLVSSHPRRDLRQLSPTLRVENRPRPALLGSRGAGFHLNQALYFAHIAWRVLRFRPALLVMDSGTTHWFFCWLFTMLGVHVVANLHNTYYPAGHASSRAPQRALRWLDGQFFRRGLHGMLGVSDECVRQAVALGMPPQRCEVYHGVFDAADLQGLQPPNPDDAVLRILYVGRLESYKGTFDLLEAFERSSSRLPQRVISLEFCGDGPARQPLADMAHSHGLGARVRFHGRLQRAQMYRTYGQCHLVVVPTQASFVEGFAMVCAEAVLTGRPFIATSVVPAHELLGAACRVVPPGDVEALASAMVEVLGQPQVYRQLQEATVPLRARFLDPANGMGAALVRLARRLGDA